MPERTLPIHLEIDLDGVLSVRFSYGQVHAVRLLGDRDQMHMIGHQAICPELEPETVPIPEEKAEIEPFVFVAEKYGLAMISPVGDVVRAIWNDNSRKSRHVV